MSRKAAPTAYSRRFASDLAELLLSFSDGGELRCLQAINRLLEDFIEEKLNLWFSEKYCADVLIPEAQKISIVDKQ